MHPKRDHPVVWFIGLHTTIALTTILNTISLKVTNGIEHDNIYTVERIYYYCGIMWNILETSSFRYAEGCHDFNEDFFKDKLTITGTEMKRGICSKFCKGYHYMSLKV